VAGPDDNGGDDDPQRDALSLVTESLHGDVLNVAGAEGPVRTSLSEGPPSPVSSRPSRTQTPAIEAPRALHLDEAERARMYFLAIAALVGACAPLVLFLGGDPVVQPLYLAVLAGIFITYATLIWQVRTPDRYRPATMLIAAVAGIPGIALTCHYFGLFSPAPIIIVLGIYYIGLTSIPHPFVFYLAFAAPHGIASLLETSGVIEDRGVVRVEELSTEIKLAVIFLEQALYAVTFMVARLSRRTTQRAVREIEEVMRQVSQREALLQEANDALERAIQAGAHGRWSGRHIGPWQLSRVLGRGGMGEVYEAVHPERSLTAALKLLHPEVATEPATLRRFLREAEIMSQIKSPHVVSIYEVGDGSNGPPYIAMERLFGKDLGWYLRRRRQMSPADVGEMVQQVASVLEAAREANIVHRDLKPQNICLSRDEGPRVWMFL
jgi:hypothetical protein